MQQIYSDVDYIRAGIEFTFISSVDDIRENSSVTVKWNANLRYKSDIMDIRLYRAVLPAGMKADVGKSAVRERFREIYSWTRGTDGGSPSNSFTDVFSWSNSSDGNLHNLNIDNDPEWNETKFDKSIKAICSGRQGVLYKIVGYSRRMSRGATPMGFFCDGKNIVALSQKNQVINNKWYAECGQVWKSGSNKTTDANECFVRVAVDMERSQDPANKKSRRVWASTNMGSIVLFDYWTGQILNAYRCYDGNSTSTRYPIYAMAYDPNHRYLVFYDSIAGKIRALTEVGDNGNVVEAASYVGSEFEATEAFAKKAIGATCTREDDKSYFYLILSNETVVKYQIDQGTIARKKIIPRTHFGCTTTVTSRNPSTNYNCQLIQTPPNSRNVFGICAGVNGQVWANGHTPVTISGTNIKPRGNPIKATIRLGNRCRDIVYKKLNRNRIPNNLWSAAGSNGTNQFVLTNDLIASANWGRNMYNEGWSSSEQNILINLWIEAWKFAGFYNERIKKKDQWISTMLNGKGMMGCKLGLNSENMVKFINYFISKNPSIDKRTVKTPITIDSVSGYKSLIKNGVDYGPTNDPYTISQIHMELVKVEDGQLDQKNKSFLQDVSYLYGCTDEENYNDSNGRIEDLENPGFGSATPNYRKTLSANEYNAKSYRYFSPTTKWSLGGYSLSEASGYYNQFFGWAGKPVLYLSGGYNTTMPQVSLDYRIGKPSNFDVRYVTGDGEVRYGFMTPKVWASAGSKYTNPDQYDTPLPLSVAGLASRVPADGRMLISRDPAKTYRGTGETNRLAYEIVYADRREGKIGFLSYDRPAATGGSASVDYGDDISAENGGRRLTYTDGSVSNSFWTPDFDRELFVASGDSGASLQNLRFCDTAPYHVAIDSDNNVWWASCRHIGKAQLLGPGTGVLDKWVYDVETNSGLHAFENNNTMLESSLVYYNEQAKIPGLRFAQNGTAYDLFELYKEGRRLLAEGGLLCSADDDANRAYLYGRTLEGNWTQQNGFGGIVSFNAAYAKDSTFGAHTSANRWAGNFENEFNSDNFGLNCLMQMNLVELGPDITHPVIDPPEARTKISKVSQSAHSASCDEENEFWGEHCAIYDDDQSASGYDDLSTTHMIYDIVTHGNVLVNHRYEYHDDTVIGGKSVTTRFVDPDGTDAVWNNNSDVVWKTPNYTGVPPYGSELMPDSSIGEYYVDLYIDYRPTVYNIAAGDGDLETVKVGRHNVKVFERWPTAIYCASGVGTVDEKTGYTDNTIKYWGECQNG